jgi:DNA-binding response OmpR family regulator
MGAVAVLAVSPAEEDRVLLSHVFSHSKWTFDCVRTRGEAVQVLERTGFGVIICAAELPDGTWKDLLAELVIQRPPPRLVVSSHLADEKLWADVLDHGGYDVLEEPFDPPEVIRVVSLAWRQWMHESERLGRD